VVPAKPGPTWVGRWVAGVELILDGARRRCRHTAATAAATAAAAAAPPPPHQGRNGNQHHNHTAATGRGGRGNGTSERGGELAQLTGLGHDRLCARCGRCGGGRSRHRTRAPLQRDQRAAVISHVPLPVQSW
jgi:hypothetical protein